MVYISGSNLMKTFTLLLLDCLSLIYGVAACVDGLFIGKIVADWLGKGDRLLEYVYIGY